MQQAFKNYNKRSTKEFNWDSFITQEVRKEYAQFVGTPRRWLLLSELAIIAHLSFKTIIYFPYPGAKPMTINPGKSDTAIIEFDGVGHFQRLEKLNVKNEFSLSHSSNQEEKRKIKIKKKKKKRNINIQVDRSEMMAIKLPQTREENISCPVFSLPTDYPSDYKTIVSKLDSEQEFKTLVRDDHCPILRRPLYDAVTLTEAKDSKDSKEVVSDEAARRRQKEGVIVTIEPMPTVRNSVSDRINPRVAEYYYHLGCEARKNNHYIRWAECWRGAMAMMPKDHQGGRAKEALAEKIGEGLREEKNPWALIEQIISSVLTPALRWLMDEIKHHCRLDKTMWDLILLSSLAFSKLNQPEQKLTVEQSVECLRAYLTIGVQEAKKAVGKQLIFFLGNTGSGKSTMVNYLHGCTMESIKLPKVLGKVIRVNPESKKTELMPIGHDGDKSKTFMPMIAIDEDIAYCDCPGFFDTRGPEVNISNLANIKTMLQNVGSIKVFIIINYNSFIADRATSIKKLIKTITDFFNWESDQKNLKSNPMESLLIGVTRLPKEEEITLGEIRESLCDRSDSPDFIGRNRPSALHFTQPAANKFH